MLYSPINYQGNKSRICENIVKLIPQNIDCIHEIFCGSAIVSLVSNISKIYLNDKMAPSTRYFKIVINEVYYTLKNEFDEKNTIRNLKKLKRYYPNLSEEFVKWLSNYAETEERIEENYNNKIIYDLTNVKDYEKAIIDYISGMTDQYIISVYNEIVSF